MPTRDEAQCNQPVHGILPVGRSDFSEFAYLPASNTQRGVLVAGCRTDVYISDVLVGCYSVTVAVQAAMVADAGENNWWLSSVYGPLEDGDKTLFLEDLEAIRFRDACPGPWALSGDFNLILNEVDKNNNRIDRVNLPRFSVVRTVTGLGLQDMHLVHGRSFTWSNERDTPTLVRLDSVLISVD